MNTAGTTWRARGERVAEVARSLCIWTLTALLILVFWPIIFVVWAFERDPNHPRTSRWVRRLSRLGTLVNPLLRIHIEGRRRTDRDRTYVIASNHQSLADIPLVSNLPLTMKWVAKASLFDVPVLGDLMRWNGDIPVNFNSPFRKREVMEKSRAAIESGSNVIFFPEGRRSMDGTLGRFHDGAFELAIRTGAPVLPVVLDGLWDFLPTHSWRFGHARDIRLRILDPVETAGLSPRDTAYLREKIRTRVLGQLAEWRGVPADAIDGILCQARAQLAVTSRDRLDDREEYAVEA